MAITNTFNYVKFIQGTQKAYDICSKDPDTLYFIYNADETVGRLYLGNRLIAGSESNNEALSLKDLTDISLTNLTDKKVLTYDENSEKWIPVDANLLIKTMVGASISTAGSTGLVPAPSAGDQGKYLRADGTWSAITGFVSTSDFAALSTTVDGKADVSSVYSKEEIDKKFEEFVPGETPTITGGLSAKIVSSTSDIDVNAKDALSYIYFISNGNEYDEYVVLELDGNRSLEKIGSLNISLDDYATKEELESLSSAVSANKTEVDGKVQNLADLLNGHSSTVEGLNDQVQDLEDLLNGITTKVDSFAQDIEDHNDRIVALETEMENKVDTDDYNTDIAEIREIMSWKILGEGNV